MISEAAKGKYWFTKMALRSRDYDTDLPYLLVEFVKMGFFELVLHFVETDDLRLALNTLNDRSLHEKALKSAISNEHLDIVKYFIDEAPAKVPLFRETVDYFALLELADDEKYPELCKYLSQTLKSDLELNPL